MDWRGLNLSDINTKCKNPYHINTIDCIFLFVNLLITRCVDKIALVPLFSNLIAVLTKMDLKK